MASRKMANARNLQQKYKPSLSCLRIQRRNYTKCNTENDTMAASGHETYTCAMEKPRTGHMLHWKTNEQQNLSRNIYDCIFWEILIC